MSAIAKVLIPNKEWLIRSDIGKIASVSKQKKGYLIIQNGKTLPFKDLTEINEQLGVSISEVKNKNEPTSQENGFHNIYEYPCSSKPYQPVYDVKKKLPLFAKSDKSKSKYCAGYYTIKFRKGWVKSFCPKLITLDRYPFNGPFKTENEMKQSLNNNKNENAA